MSSSIYNIETWDGNRNYKPNDIVEKNGNYYYAKQHIINCNTCEPHHNDGAWVGYIKSKNDWRPHFSWVPSYDSSVDFRPRTKIIKYGQKVVEQRLKDGLNSDLINLSLKFDKREIDESTAILHFLHRRAGKDPFVFDPPAPFNFPDGAGGMSNNTKHYRIFLCKDWTSTYNFYNNYTISATFTEVANYHNKGKTL